MTQHRILVLGLFFFLVAPILLAEHFVSVHSLKSEDDDIQGVIYDMLQDEQGFIWFCTINGLHRYDGVNIVKYAPQAGSSAATMPRRINSIMKNGQGDIWCWNNGLYLFDKESAGFLDLSEVSNAYVQDVDDRPLAVNNDLQAGYSVILLQSGKMFKISNSDPLNDHSPWTGLWKIADKQGIPNVENGKKVFYTQDTHGTSWKLSEDGHLSYYDEQQQSYCLSKTIDMEHAEQMIVRTDQQGNFWLRRTYGLDCLSLHTTAFDFLDELSSGEVRAMMKDDKGRLWLASKDSTLFYIDSLQGNKYYVHPSGRISSRPAKFPSAIYSLMQSRDGRIWLGSRYSGIYVLETKHQQKDYRVKHYHQQADNEYSLSSNQIFDICEDNRGRIWIATFGGGVNLYANDLFFHMGNRMAADAQYAPRNVRYIKEIGKDTLLACAKEGLFTWSGNFSRVEQVSFYVSSKQGEMNDLSDTDVMQYFSDSRSESYVVTHSGGLCKLLSNNLLQDRLPFQRIDSEHGLASDVTLSMIEDAQGRLWVTSYNALSCIDKEEMYVFSGKRFSRQVLFSECEPIVYEGKLIFSTHRGLMCFDPQQVLEKTPKDFPLVFTDISVENKAAQHRLESGNSLTLKPGERNLSLSFMAIDFFGETDIRYSYCLEGVDQTWRQSTQHAITYLNLPPGKHTFRLKCTDYNGLWSGRELRLSLNVLPKFTESFWFLLLIFVIVLGLALVGVYIYHRFYQLRNRLDMEQEMTDIKMRFFTDLSHELRTPLTLIDGPINAVLDDAQLPAVNRRYLETAQKNVRHILNLVNQILDFRKIQSNKMTLIVEYIPIVDLIRSVMEKFEVLAIKHHMDFRLITDALNQEDVRIWADRDKMEKICFNLLSNAFKYTPESKSIYVEVEQSQQEIIIHFSDEGCGIDAKQSERIFNRYETIAKNNLFKPSSGIGLSLVKHFVELHHARIQLSSVPGEGSCFSLVFQKGNKHFQDDENVQMIVNDAPSPLLDESSSLADDSEFSLKDHELPLILVAEDNIELRQFIKSVLQDDYQILEADNGQDALEKAHQYWPSLIVSDIMMPRMDGFEFLKQIRSDDDIYSIPFVLLTAKNQVDERIKGMDYGADDYIIKPFSTKYLKARIANLLQQQERFKRHLLSQLEMPSADDKMVHLDENAPHLTQADKELIHNIQVYIENNIDNADITIDDVARALYMGRSRFNKKIKQLFGLTPLNFIKTMRIQRAHQLLLCGEYNVSEVAFRTGFNDPKYFTRCFKRYYGTTPRDLQSGRKTTED